MKQPFNKDIIFLALLTILVCLAGIYGAMKLPEIYSKKDTVFDHKRVVDLALISDAIAFAYEQGTPLPDTLKNLPALEQAAYGTEGSLQVNDPQTNKPYTYKKLSDTSYEVCANFITDTMSGKDTVASDEYDYATYQAEFKHPRGNYCFTRTVTPLTQTQDYYDPYAPTPTVACLGACPEETGGGGAGGSSSAIPAQGTNQTDVPPVFNKPSN